MLITVIVPTYRRPNDLARCLEALQAQQRSPDEVLVIVRDSDTSTWNFLRTFNINGLALKLITVHVPGVVAAMNAGLNAAQGDLLSFTDDDAAPHGDWLQRIETYFLADRQLGGVGGRDWIYCDNKLLAYEPSQVVGCLQWFGRVIGNHHIGVGEPREVDVLKGVNMSFRRSAIATLQFDERMKGTGAQVHFELAFSLALKQLGWKLIYDPAIAVDHHGSKRFDEDQREQFNPIAFSNAVHNETLALLQYLPAFRRIIFLIWAILVGTRHAVGFVQWFRLLPSQGSLATSQLTASLYGRWQGWQTWQKTQPSFSSNWDLKAVPKC
jgi:glycosyltransferase involved in cell wall biosynthesis